MPSHGRRVLAVKTVTSRVISGTWSKRIVIVPLLALGTAIMLVFDLPMAWRWEVSESSFVKVARNQMDLPDDHVLDLYTITDIIDGRDATFFETEGGGENAGFLYSSMKDPLNGEYDHDRCPNLTLRSLGDRHYGWYEYSCE